MRRITYRLGLFLLIAIFVYTAYRQVGDYVTAQGLIPQEETVVESSYVEVDPLDTLLVQQTDSGSRKMYRCLRDCKPEAIPVSLGEDALSDGESWYHYVQIPGDGKSEAKIALQRTWVGDKTTTTIIEQTPLVKPRGLYMSPDGRKVAYWLDNINDEKKQLTELWVYDAQAGGASLIAENVHVPDVLTRLRWDSSGKLVWFIGDSGKGDETKVELIVVHTEPARVGAVFSQLDWSEYRRISDTGIMDISMSGDKVALAIPGDYKRSALVIAEDGFRPHEISIAGTVVYAEWQEQGDLLYITQEQGVTYFWKYTDGTSKEIARHRGIFKSGRSDGTSEHVVFASSVGQNTSRLFTLQLATGLIKEQAIIPSHYAGVHVVQVKARRDGVHEQVAGVTTELQDSELVAFIEKHFKDIVGVSQLFPSRIIISSHVNTLYVDYELSNGVPQRMLITVRDAVHPEWTIKGRYEALGGEWRKVQGGGLEDPKPLRIYEWEMSVEKWILKQEIAQK